MCAELRPLSGGGRAKFDRKKRIIPVQFGSRCRVTLKRRLSEFSAYSEYGQSPHVTWPRFFPRNGVREVMCHLRCDGHGRTSRRWISVRGYEPRTRKVRAFSARVGKVRGGGCASAPQTRASGASARGDWRMRGAGLHPPPLKPPSRPPRATPPLPWRENVKGFEFTTVFGEIVSAKFIDATENSRIPTFRYCFGITQFLRRF